MIFTWLGVKKGKLNLHQELHSSTGAKMQLRPEQGHGLEKKKKKVFLSQRGMLDNIQRTRSTKSVWSVESDLQIHQDGFLISFVDGA